jgi:hypothetical protein
MNSSRLVLGIAGLAIAIGLIIFYTKDQPVAPGSQISSFEECRAAGNQITETTPKECRTPSGEVFVEEQLVDAWKEYSDPSRALAFHYPETLNTHYIQAVNWPPTIQIVSGSVGCSNGGEPEDASGKTERRTINGRDYCVNEKSEGAAGSIYTQYGYAFGIDEKAAVLMFSLRLPQCSNYDISAKAECEAERDSFDLDRMVDDIAQTLVIKNP